MILVQDRFDVAKVGLAERTTGDVAWTQLELVSRKTELLFNRTDDLVALLAGPVPIRVLLEPAFDVICADERHIVHPPLAIVATCIMPRVLLHVQGRKMC